jgi:hypothetical protein
MKVTMYLIALEKGFQGSGCINGWQSRHGGKDLLFLLAPDWLVASSGFWRLNG